MKTDEMLFKLFILAYYGFTNCDEYLYGYFNRKKYRLAQAMFESFPYGERCDSLLRVDYYENDKVNYIN